jgi:hypothetical protein
VVALRPDLILDLDSTDLTYVSLGDRMQSQTSTPT